MKNPEYPDTMYVTGLVAPDTVNTMPEKTIHAVADHGQITGDTVTITQDANGEIEVFTSVGKPAYYEQKPAVDKEIVKAYGLTIQYFAANERIVLLDQAKVVQEGNTFEGEKIVYDTRRQIVNAGRATNTDVSTPRPRVDMVIQPRKREQAAEQPQ